MRKRSGGAAVSASSLLSPKPSSPPPSKSKKPLGLGLAFMSAASKKVLSPSSASPLHRDAAPTSTPQKPLVTVSDLREMASARAESLKRHLDLCHAEVLKDFEASHTRISKRLKLQTQACMQLTEEAEKEYKKMADRITENTELVKAEYVEFIKEAQATANRVCKVSIPELAQSLEKAVDGLRTNMGFHQLISTDVTYCHFQQRS